MSRKKLLVPEARAALNEFKVELAKEMGVDSPEFMASAHTGQITRKLVEMAEKQLLDE